MNRHEHILTILGEEGNEVAHRVSKALRFGLTEAQRGHDRDNAQRITDEVGDVLGMFLWAVDEGLLPPLDLSPEGLDLICDLKRDKVECYFIISREHGSLSE